MKIALGADHKGYELKNHIAEYLRTLGHEIKDFGTYSNRSCDYPVFARRVSRGVSCGRYDRGVLACQTGIGMSMAGKIIRGARAALCFDKYDAEMSRKHNDSNIIVFSAGKTDYHAAKSMLEVWLNTEFEGGRHMRRVLEMDGLYTMVGVSLLSKNSEEMKTDLLAEKIKSFEACGVDEIHFDVIDGKYNDGENNWDYQGPLVIKDLRKVSELPFMAHLMTEDPIKYVKAFGDAGCDVVVFHAEAYRNMPEFIEKTIEEINSCGMQAGIAIEPDTPVNLVFPYLDSLDRVLVMTVNTGFAGQGFIDKTDKIRDLAKMRDKYEFWIAVDGGINKDTAALCRKAGANMLYAASYIQKSENPKAAIELLRG